MEFTPIVAKAGNGIYEAVTDVGLIHIHIIRGCDCEGHGPCVCGWADGHKADGCGSVGAHQARVEANAWSGEQDLGS
ncbi:MAG: hypothetical protein J6P66_07865 [Bacteroidaceae bacterium]|nr:hypothetical protein [Bacteroidaceae bacterium]